MVVMLVDGGQSSKPVIMKQEASIMLTKLGGLIDSNQLMPKAGAPESSSRQKSVLSFLEFTCSTLQSVLLAIQRLLSQFCVATMDSDTTSVPKHLLKYVLVAVAASTVYVLGLVAYRLFLHPYAKYPGPFWAKISYFYAFYHAWIGDTGQAQHWCHERYGT